MLGNVCLLGIGLLLLVVFSNVFVNSASALATHFKVPKMVIALTIAAFCTCTPELAISFQSVAGGNYDVTVANVIGSCIINVLLIVGLASVVRPITIKTQTVTKELPLLVVTSIVFMLLFLDGTLSRLDAMVLILLFVTFCLYLVRMIKRFKKLETETPNMSKGKAIVMTLIAIVAITIGSDLVVNATTYISEALAISAKIITMTVVGIGTSLPELMITITSAKKGEFDMSVGNIIGTNIFNICIVLGLPTLLLGNVTPISFHFIDLFMVVVAALSFYFLGKSSRRISRVEGMLMLFIFLFYYAYVFIV